MIGIFLQVRLDSARLPGKALLPLGGKPIIAQAMDSLRRIDADVYALLTDESSKDRLSPFAEECGFKVFSGPKLDVLHRYALAVEKYAVDTVVRATGDNPLVSWELCSSLLKEHQDLGSDYSGHIGMPIGFGVEIVRSKCILEADRLSDDSYEREHVTPYIYNHPEIHFLHRPLCPLYCRGREKLSVDTLEDYEKMLKIYDSMETQPPFLLQDIMRLLRSEGRRA